MPHADSSLIPEDVQTKKQFYEHVYRQLSALLSGQRSWVTNCANAASLMYNSLLAFESYFGSGSNAVNWCGVYLDAALFPQPTISISKHSTNQAVLTAADTGTLLLGPFCGKPACQFINVEFGRARGVCADAYLRKQTLLVRNVEDYPGHIACDGDSKSEIVCPLILDGRCIGVLDLDCLALGGFDEEDKLGLERLAQLIVNSCDW